MQACHRKTMPCNMQHAPGSRGYATCKKSFMQSCKLSTWYPCKLVAWNHVVWVACDVITSLCYYVMESMWESISPSCKKMQVCVLCIYT